VKRAGPTLPPRTPHPLTWHHHPLYTEMEREGERDHPLRALHAFQRTSCRRYVQVGREKRESKERKKKMGGNQ